MSLSHHDAAGLLLDARRKGYRIPASDTTPPQAGPEWAYAVQQSVVGALGPVGAFKTGRVEAGATPIMAPILASAVRPSPAMFGPTELDRIGIELEVAFRVDQDLPDPGDPDFEARVRERVSVAPAIEVVDSRLADYDAVDPLWKLADNQINAGLVYGKAIGEFDRLALDKVKARLMVGEETVFDGDAAVPGGDAFETFCAFVRLVGGHCGGLRPGQLVTTGSVTGLRFIDSGRKVTGTIEGLGSVEVDFR